MGSERDEERATAPASDDPPPRSGGAEVEKGDDDDRRGERMKSSKSDKKEKKERKESRRSRSPRRRSRSREDRRGSARRSSRSRSRDRRRSRSVVMEGAIHGGPYVAYCHERICPNNSCFPVLCFTPLILPSLENTSPTHALMCHDNRQANESPPTHPPDTPLGPNADIIPFTILNSFSASLSGPVTDEGDPPAPAPAPAPGTVARRTVRITVARAPDRRTKQTTATSPGRDCQMHRHRFVRDGEHLWGESGRRSMEDTCGENRGDARD